MVERKANRWLDFPIYTETTLPKEGPFSLSFRIRDGSNFQSVFIRYKERMVGTVELYRESKQNEIPYFSTVWPTNIDPITGRVIIAASYIRLRNQFHLPEQDPKQYEENIVPVTSTEVIEPITFMLSPIKAEETIFLPGSSDNFEPLICGLSLEKDEDRDKAIFVALTEHIPPFHWLRFNTLFGYYYFDGEEPLDDPFREEREFGFIGTGKNIKELVDLYAQTATVQLDSRKDYEAL